MISNPFNKSVPTLRVNLEAENTDQRQLSSVLTLSTGSTQANMMRTESFNGRDYTVVPVVAIVEGVLHGANAAAPEFAAASEFGKFPKAWDGRPVVMNHPQISGVFVSASIPEVLEDYGMGYIFNTRVEDSKLKTEAWLDHARIEEVGGELLSTLERIRNNEVVEVSVGAWLDVVPGPGTYNGKTYQGSWANVAPDHLAFLSEGTQGACSVADGCGVPRLFRANHAAIGAQASEEPCCSGCAEGKGCDQPNINADDALTPQAILRMERQSNAFLEMAQLSEGFSVNAIPGNMAFDDIFKLLDQSLVQALNVPYYDLMVYAVTQDSVVYKVWGQAGLQQRAYSVTEDGAVSLAGEVTPVNLLTRIVPRQTEPTITPNSERTDTMPEATPGGGEPVVETPAEGTGIAPAADQVNANAAAPTPTFEALLAAAPPEMRESFNQGLKMFSARKESLVKALSANERCKFTEEQLKGMDIDVLENMAELAQVNTFEGRQPGPVSQDGVDAQQQPAAFAAAPTSYLGNAAAA